MRALKQSELYGRCVKVKSSKDDTAEEKGGIKHLRQAQEKKLRHTITTTVKPGEKKTTENVTDSL